MEPSYSTELPTSVLAACRLQRVMRMDSAQPMELTPPPPPPPGTDMPAGPALTQEASPLHGPSAMEGQHTGADGTAAATAAAAVGILDCPGGPSWHVHQVSMAEYRRQATEGTRLAVADLKASPEYKKHAQRCLRSDQCILIATIGLLLNLLGIHIYITLHDCRYI